ncbi:MAG: hypothetical protein LBN07_04915, partial [Christensenellaceae bacterium]|nr:hypothetical protein [Christensenellaceae bacterium]
MKKTLVCVMLLLFAVAGVLVGCGGDKYDNLRINVSLVSGEASAGVLEPTFEGDVLTLELNSLVVMRFDVSGVGGINGALRFVCDDADALEITDKQYGASGTTATIKALKPTYGNNYFTLKALSVETNKNPKEIRIKVIAPIAEINFNKSGTNQQFNLVATRSITNGSAVVVNGSVNLNSYINLISKYPPFATNQTQVDFSVDTLNPIASAIILNNGVLSIAEHADVEGIINITATSRYNSAVSAVIPITVVKNVEINSVGLSGKSNGTTSSSNTQIIFNDSNPNIYDKTAIDLFSNSESYHKEEFSFRVNTPVPVEVNAVFKSGADIAEVTKGQYFETIDGGGHVTSAVQNFLIDANKVRSGQAVLGFEIKLKGYDNQIKYNVSEDADLTVRVSAVGRGISLKQGNTVIDQVNDRLTVYDIYGDSDSSREDLGIKLSFGVSTGTTVEIDPQNRSMFLTILDAGNSPVVTGNSFDAFILTRENGTSILPQQYNGQWGFVVNNNEAVYMLFNPSGGLLVGNYKLVVSTMVEYFALNSVGAPVDFYNNTSGALGADGFDDRLAEVRTVEYLMRAAMGISDIELSYGLDTSNPTNAAIENDLNINGIVLKYQGSSTNILLKVTPIDADLEAIQGMIDSTFVGLVQTSPLQFNLTGLKRGDGQFVIDAGNGRKIAKPIKVVDELAGENIIVRSDSAYSSIAISEVLYHGDGSISKITAKAGGKFNVFVTTITAAGNGIISNAYSIVGNRTNATVTNAGVISTFTETDSNGITIEVATKYYKFTTIGGNFVPQLSTKTNSFDLVIYVASNNIRLNTEITEVYDSNSLGFSDQNMSMFSIYPIIMPSNATINNESGHVTYSVINPDGSTGWGTYLINNGAGNFQAVKPTPEGQPIRLVVNINEFGVEIKLVCRVFVKTAAQMSKITLEDINYTKYDLPYRAIRVGQQTDVKYITSPSQVFNNNLKFVLYNYNESTHALIPYDQGTGLIDMQNSGLVRFDGSLAQSITNDNINVLSLVGRGDFRIVANNNGKAGYVVLRIFAVDHMTGSLSGTIYVDLLIEIENGTILHPFSIYNAEDLSSIREAPSLHYRLMNNISLHSISSWQPISNFSGTLNGFNLVSDIADVYNSSRGIFFEIRGLRLSSSNVNVGLFADSRGGLLNLRLTGVIISLEGQSVTNASALVGQNNGLILNCSVEFNGYNVRNLTGAGSVNIGALAGKNTGDIINFANSMSANGGQGDNANTTRNIANYYFGGDEARYEDPTDFAFGNVISAAGVLSSGLGIGLLNSEEDKLIRIRADTVLNPISGSINVSDGAYTVNVGGITGTNSGSVYGVYTLYRATDEIFAPSGSTSPEFVTAYQAQGVDALININSNSSFAITNPNSAVGGIVGKNISESTIGTIYNVSSGGTIKALDNVGGIFGVSSGAGTQIWNALAFVNITARNNVGGVGGLAEDGTDLRYLRAENYEERGAGINSPKLISAGNMGISTSDQIYIGGVIGRLMGSSLSYAYASEFVNDPNFVSISTQSYSSAMYVGGVVGAAENSIVERAFAKLFISAYGSIGGVAGASDSELSDVYFLGNIANAAGIPVSGAILGTALNNINITGYHAYFDGIDYDVSVLSTVGAAGTYSVTAIVQTNVAGLVSMGGSWWSNDIADMAFNEGYPVLRVDYSYGAGYPLFVRKVPSAISVLVNDNPLIGYGERFYQDDSGALVLKYSVANSKDSFGNSINILSLNELLKVETIPSNLGTVQIVVESSNRSILDIDNSGKIHIYGTGTVTLTLYARLNVSAVDTIEVKIIPYISRMALYTSNNLNAPGNNYLYDDATSASAGNTIAIRKSLGANMNYLQLYPVFYDGNIVVNSVGYGIVYERQTSSAPPTALPVTGVSTPVAIDQNNKLSVTDISSHMIWLNAQVTQIEGVTLSSPLSLLGTKYFEVRGFEGATNITLSRTSLEIAPLALYVGEGSITVEMTSDVTISEGYQVRVYEIKNSERVLLDLTDPENPFDILDAITFDYPDDYSASEGKYRKPYGINLAQDYISGKKIITQDRDFVFEFIAFSNPNILTELDVRLIHQDIINVTAGHHLFKQMENVSVGNSLFTFNTSSSDEIISGEFGLLMVNTYPQSASIERITVESSVVGGNYIGFSQLVAINEYNPTGINSYAY